MSLKLLDRCLAWWRARRLSTPPVPSATAYSAGPASEGMDTHVQMFKDLITGPVITKRDLNNLSKAFFNTEVTSSQYRFRSGGPYGLVLSVEKVDVVRNAQGGLADILLTLQDCSLDTSLSVTLSVKDLEEMLCPFTLTLPFAAR